MVWDSSIGLSAAYVSFWLGTALCVLFCRPIEANQLRDRALMLDESPIEEENGSNLGMFRSWEHLWAIMTISSISCVGQEHAAAPEPVIGGMVEIIEGNPPKSTTSSSDGSVRSRMTRFFASWKNDIMGRELADLQRMHWRIFLAASLIAACSTIAFGLTDSLLYESIAKANLDLIDRARPFRLDLIRSLFLVRNLVMAEIKNDTTTLSTVRSQLNEISLEFSSAHLENFELAPSNILELYGDEKWRIEFPTGIRQG